MGSTQFQNIQTTCTIKSEHTLITIVGERPLCGGGGCVRAIAWTLLCCNSLV